jgi:hypothetical protein
MQHYETATVCRGIYRAGSDSLHMIAGQVQFKLQCKNHGHPSRKLHQREAASCNKISVVRSETKGGSQKNDSAVWWKLYE